MAGAYVGTASIADIDTAKTIYIIGSNPRNEAPTLNARIRKAWLNGASVKLIGEPCDLTYEYHHCGTGRKSLKELIKSEASLAGDQESVVILGQGAIRDEDGLSVLSKVMELAEKTEVKF